MEFPVKQLGRERLQRRAGRITGLARGLGRAGRRRWESVHASRGRGRWGQSSLAEGRVASERSEVSAAGDGGVEEIRRSN